MNIIKNNVKDNSSWIIAGASKSLHQNVFIVSHIEHKFITFLMDIHKVMKDNIRRKKKVQFYKLLMKHPVQTFIRDASF